MAVELKKFQDEFKKIQGQIATAYGEWKTVGDSQGNTRKLTEGAKLAIGDRIGELKTKGAQGTTPADFQQDAEVKAAVDTVKSGVQRQQIVPAGQSRLCRHYGDGTEDGLDRKQDVDDCVHHSGPD